MKKIVITIKKQKKVRTATKNLREITGNKNHSTNRCYMETGSLNNSI
ncbi:MAG: hypothetical protein Q4B86_05510 [Eubacteriales bacterium]|nr:hypothetical protein [Eubacteriales bacterium]